jgi:putative redox protein
MIRNRPGTPTVVSHAGGVKFSIRIRSHEIVVDQTIAGGGCDTAPTPLELLGASLGSCIAYYVYHFFHSRGLPADDVVVEVTQNQVRNPNRIESFGVKLTLPANLPDKYLPLLQRVLDTCPVHNTLKTGARIDVEFVSPVLAESVA